MKYMLIITVFIFSGCVFFHVPEFETEAEIFYWVSENIEYYSDKENIVSEFRSYSSIVNSGYGDCSQYAVASICLLKWHLGIEADLAAIKTGGYLHAVVKIGDELIDPVSYPNWNWTDYELFGVLDHEIVMAIYGQ